MFEKFLEELGLSDKEAQVYLSLLKVDNDSVLDLSKRTKINRTTIYPVLESLSKKGLVSEVQIDKKVRFHAEPPERLETYVERQKVNLDEHSKRLKDIIPQLKSEQREGGEKPVIKYFEGKEGILHVNQEFAKSAKNDKEIMYMIYPKQKIEDIFSKDDTEKFQSLRSKHKVKSKSIFTYPNKEYPSTKDAERLQIDEKKYPISADISIYEDRVLVSTLGSKLSTILIKSIDLANTLKSIVNYAHDNNKK